MAEKHMSIAFLYINELFLSANTVYSEIYFMLESRLPL